MHKIFSIFDNNWICFEKIYWYEKSFEIWYIAPHVFFILKCILTFFLNRYSKISFIDVIEMICSDFNQQKFICLLKLTFNFFKAIMTECKFLFPYFINNKNWCTVYQPIKSLLWIFLDTNFDIWDMKAKVYFISI